MAITVLPVDLVAGEPLYSGREWRQAQSALIAGATTARPLGARSGVRPGTSTATVTATSVTWTCKPHAGVLDTQSAAEAGPYLYAVDADETGAVTAANATNPRKDIVYAQLSDPAESDGSSVPGVAIGYVAGTTNVSGTLVVSTPPARSITLAEINVPISGGGSPTVTWVAPRAVGAGGIIPMTTLPGTVLGSADDGVWIDVAGSLYRGNGTAWKAVSLRSAAWTTNLASSLAAAGYIIGTGWTWRIVLQNDMATLEATRIARASGTQALANNTDYTLLAAGTVPAALCPVRDQDVMGHVRTSGGLIPVRFTLAANGSVTMMVTALGTVTLGVYNPANSYASIPAITYPLA